jgi:hypothetical protein
MSAMTAVRDGWRDGAGVARSCMVCCGPLASSKAQYCSRACQQRAYRLRQAPAAALDEGDLRQALQRRHVRAAHTLYECPACGERFLGEQRCGECHRFCRAIGLGGRCPDCDTLILLSELLEGEVLT